jgi:hypothetical protein
MTDEKKTRRMKDVSPDGILTTQWDGVWARAGAL